MAFVGLNNAQTTWWLANRNGGLPAGTIGSCLVSDLAVGDYLVGARGTITALGTSGTTRTVTFTRLGVSTTATWVSASSLIIIRP